jgi:hypothetical protein
MTWKFTQPNLLDRESDSVHRALSQPARTLDRELPVMLVQTLRMPYK